MAHGLQLISGVKQWTPLTSAEVVTTVHDKVPVQFERIHIESLTNWEQGSDCTRSQARSEGVDIEGSVHYGRRVPGRNSQKVVPKPPEWHQISRLQHSWASNATPGLECNNQRYNRCWSSDMSWHEWGIQCVLVGVAFWKLVLAPIATLTDLKYMNREDTGRILQALCPKWWSPGYRH